MESGIGLSDLIAVMNTRDRDEFGGGWMWFIFLFFIFAMFGNGNLFGRNSGDAPLTTDGYALGNIQDSIRGVQQGIADSTYAINGAITGLGTQMQNCCCATQKEIIESRYAAERNACDIVNAIHADGEATRALINQNVMQELRDNLQAAQLQLGNLAQTQTLLNELRPFPAPAYITCSPYAAVQMPYAGYGCGCGV